ncbi:MAG: GntR family transcriptional regulator [Capsulimonadaceae bacterium]|nr:GntR family transcriptional regulator [Capsulimonadaceae bacterium]
MNSRSLTQKSSKSYPAHYRIADEMRRRMRDGDLASGSLLASRRELADEFGVAVATMQKAITLLVEDGHLEVRGRWRTFVRKSETAMPSVDIDREERPARLRARVPLVAGIIWKADEDAQNFWVPVVNTIEMEVSRRHGMSRHVDLGAAASSALSLSQAADKLIAEGATGLISLLFRPSDELGAFFAHVAKTGVPLVHAGSSPQRNCALSASFSSVDAGYQAASHLLSRGCERLLFFSGFTTDWVEQRARGAREALESARMPGAALGVSIGPIDLNDYVADTRISQLQIQFAYEAAVRVLSGGLPADGILAANDNCATGFIQAAREAGLRPGVDFAIIGFDNWPQARDLGLTTFQAPFEAIGKELVNILARAIDEPALTLRLNVPFELIARESTMMYERRLNGSMPARAVG